MPVSSNHHTPLSAGVNSVSPINVALGELDWAIDQLSGGSSGSAAGVIVALASDVAVAGDDRNLIIAAESGTADDLIEVTGLSVGQSVLLRADAGDTITVKHNDAGATVKIYLHGDADVILDEQNPLRLTLVDTDVLVQDVMDAVSVSYTPAVATDWDGDADPGDVSDALNQLAERVDDLEGAGGGGGAYTSVAILRDEKASGTAGGSSSSTTWNNRNLNTEAYDPDGIVTISSNKFIPIAGEYEIRASSVVLQTASNTTTTRNRVYNVTAAAAVEEGLVTRSTLPAATFVTTFVTVVAKFTANGTDEYRIDTYTSIGVATSGLGSANSDGSPECYTEVELRKLS